MSNEKKSLGLYTKKRDFTKTSEPPVTKKTRSKKNLLFVVQKHQASQLHYDFRLEVDGVLKSWAVPKGLSGNPAQKRLAVQTEDHPLAYAYFEGTIAQGNYGAGVVMVWDIGTYTVLQKDTKKRCSLLDALHDGQIEIFLKGKKLYGAYVLVRLQRLSSDTNWLLIKMRDEYAKTAKRMNNRSVLSGKTLKQIEHDAKKKG